MSNKEEFNNSESEFNRDKYISISWHYLKLKFSIKEIHMTFAKLTFSIIKRRVESIYG